MSQTAEVQAVSGKLFTVLVQTMVSFISPILEIHEWEYTSCSVEKADLYKVVLLNEIWENKFETIMAKPNNKKVFLENISTKLNLKFNIS